MNRKDQTTNMTVGNPYQILLFFALPLMAGNVFQQLYTVTDTAIVGRAIGVDALAALGTVEWMNWLFLGVIQGITQGFSILAAQRFGADDLPGMRRANGNSILLCGICAAALLILAQGILELAFLLLGVPKEIVPIARTYLRILFSGIPAVMAYNMLSCILRAVGDSHTPLQAMLLSSLTNIVLDLLFVVVLHFGVAGAAAATVIAQVLAALYCLRKVFATQALKMERPDFRLSGQVSRTLGRLAAPMAFQNLVIAVGGMIVQMVVNRYGVAFIAGYTATSKLYGVLEVAAISYGYAMATYAGQNKGAGDMKRISLGLRAGLVISMITSVLITLLMVTCGRWILSLFIDISQEGGPDAMVIGLRFLLIMSLCLPILYVLHIVRSCIQGMGNTVIPMLSGFAEFIMRTGSSLLLPAVFGADGILFAEVIAWLGADLVLIPGYFRERK